MLIKMNFNNSYTNLGYESVILKKSFQNIQGGADKVAIIKKRGFVFYLERSGVNLS